MLGMSGSSITRRTFFAAAASPLFAAAPSLDGALGVTTSTLDRHIGPNMPLLELPRVLANELDLRVIDLNTNTLGESSPADLDRLKAEAERAGCILTNLKINRRDIDMAAPDPGARRHALGEYKKAIDVAARLGCRWARPLPLDGTPDMRLYVDGYRELADYAAQRNITMLVENWGWMQGDADAIPKIIKAVGRNIAASPDVGNWTTDAVRYDGLGKAFPLAATCDFKFFDLGPNGEHEQYDLRKCLEMGWTAGFRGPWCFERANPDRAMLFKELALARDLLRQWMRSA
jgi:hypothetical protein